jgi:hypothetical protein
MAKTAKKNQKFDRNRKRSPAMARYRMEERWKVNKRKKVQRHVRENPKDVLAAGALKAVTVGGGGPAGKFPAHVRIEEKHTPDGVNDLELEFRKHRVEYVRKDGKRKRVVILDEQVASGPIYWVEAEGRVLEVSISMEDAQARYTRSRAAAHIVQRDGSGAIVLKSKRAQPLGNLAIKYEQAFAG